MADKTIILMTLTPLDMFSIMGLTVYNFGMGEKTTFVFFVD